MTSYRMLATVALVGFSAFAANASTQAFDQFLPPEFLSAPLPVEIYNPAPVEFYSSASLEADPVYSIQTYSLVYVLVSFDVLPVFMAQPGGFGSGGLMLAPDTVGTAATAAVVPAPAALPLLGGALLAMAAAARSRSRARRA